MKVFHSSPFRTTIKPKPKTKNEIITTTGVTQGVKTAKLQYLAQQ